MTIDPGTATKKNTDGGNFPMEMLSMVLAFLAILSIVASAFFYQQPTAKFARSLNHQVNGMNILGWERVDEQHVSAVVENKRGWYRSPGGPAYDENTISVAKFSYPIGDGSPQYGKNISEQLNQDIDALAIGHKPASFKGFYSTGHFASVGSIGSDGSMARMGIGLGLMMMPIVLLLTLKPATRKNSETRGFAMLAASLVILGSILNIVMLQDDMLFTTMSYLTPIAG